MTSLVARTVAIDGRLQPTDLALQAGEMVALIGPNGGGKTSLLRALAGAEMSSGRVMIEGEDLGRSSPARRRRLLAFLPASRDMVWPISVTDVIALGLPAPDDARVQELIELFELGPLAGRPVDRLSTGERAKVLMARAMAGRPRVLLLDEPLSNLDPYWVLRFLELLRLAAREEDQAILVALHDLSHLPRFDRVLLVASGRIQMDEAPAGIKAGGRFEEIFRIGQDPEGGWSIRRPADPQSSP